MKYMGSKNRIAKYILPIILKDRKPNQWFVDVFAGGFNVIDKICGNRIACDVDFYLIELFKALQSGWMPPTSVSENEYLNIRANKKDYPAYLVGYVGFNSYGAKFFGGFRRDSIGKRDYWLEHYNNVIKQAKYLKGIVIENTSYLNLRIPLNSIIYCDPPYAGVTEYKHRFNHKEFWQWCRDMTTEGHSVFISEYVAPDDFVSIWQMKVNNTLVKNTGSKQGIENLFVLRNS